MTPTLSECRVTEMPRGTFGREYARIVRKTVLACIACQIGDGEAHPSKELLAAFCEISLKELDQTIGWLITAGLLAFEPETGYRIPTYQNGSR